MAAGPLLYRPPPSWQFWTALIGALVIEAGSVLIAGIKHEPPAVDLSSIPTATVEAMLQPEDQPTPPPEDNRNSTKRNRHRRNKTSRPVR
ncbi:MAG: hypothetical protein DME57_10920 [Verrucomicrobia bacterium]|nr:MAG: hypothetical protein DME57_10920 [Verrucomicrobiota bacterium]